MRGLVFFCDVDTQNYIADGVDQELHSQRVNDFADAIFLPGDFANERAEHYITIKEGEVTIDAPVVNINGDVKINGIAQEGG